jgi:hypothetical protein
VRPGGTATSSPTAIDTATSPFTSDSLSVSSAREGHGPFPSSVLHARMPWLFEPSAADCPWALIVHAHAHVALRASNDTVAEQGVEEAMRTLHKHVGAWNGDTLVATFATVHETLFAGDLVPSLRGKAAVHIREPALSRLLGCFQTYLPSLWTLLISEYNTLGADALRRLLDSLLVLLHVDSMTAVRAGVAALHQMSIVVAGNGGAELDYAGWAAFADMLSAACSMDTVTAVPAAQRYHTLTLVQTTISQILKHCGRCMPPMVHLQVLAVLQDSVERAAEASGSPEQLAALARELDMTAGASAKLNGHARNGHAPVGLGHDPILGDVSSSQRADGGLSDAAGLAYVHLGDNRTGHDRGEYSVMSDSLTQALQLLRKQQNHGGRLLIKTYLFTIESFRSSAARHPALVEAHNCMATAQSQLLAMCHHLIYAFLVPCIDGERNEGKAVRCWDVAENSEVLCAALKALARHQGGGQWVQEMMPSLCGLMRIGDKAVRDALADIFESVVWPQIESGL